MLNFVSIVMERNDRLLLLALTHGERVYCCFLLTLGATFYLPLVKVEVFE